MSRYGPLSRRCSPPIGSSMHPEPARAIQAFSEALCSTENGARLTPSHAVKDGVRYRYYVSRALVVGHARNCRDGWRIPAGDLERGVVQRLRALLTDPGALMDAIGDDEANATNLDEMIQRARKIARELSDAEPQRIKGTLAALACRVEVGAGSLKITLPRHRLVALLASGDDAEAEGAATPADPADQLTLEAPAALRRVGREMRLLVEGGDAPAAPDPSLIRLLARAEALKTRLIEQPTLTIPALAAR